MEPKENIQFKNEDIKLEVRESFNKVDYLFEDENNAHITLKFDINNPLESSIEEEDVNGLQGILLESGLIPKDNHFRSFEIYIDRMSYISSINHTKLNIALKYGILDFDSEKYPNLSTENFNISNAFFEYSLKKVCGEYNYNSMSCDSIEFDTTFNSYEELIADKLKGIDNIHSELEDLSQSSFECSQNISRKSCRKLLGDVDIKLLNWYFEVLKKRFELVRV